MLSTSTLASLETARQKLQQPDVPLMLRITYYLRVSCTCLEAPSLGFSDLMCKLYQYDALWMQKCSVTEAGILRSPDRWIDQLLTPITLLHTLATEAPELPAAA